MFRHDVRPEEGSEVCDFCTYPYVHACYPCDDFVTDVIAGIEIASKGPWAACEICSGKIEREDWVGLTDRSVRKFCRNFGVPYEMMYPEIEKNLKLFRQHMKMAA